MKFTIDINEIGVDDARNRHGFTYLHAYMVRSALPLPLGVESGADMHAVLESATLVGSPHERACAVGNFFHNLSDMLQEAVLPGTTPKWVISTDANGVSVATVPQNP